MGEEQLQSVLDKINKDYGAGTIMELGSSEAVPVEAIPTGSLALDRALGLGGLPRGRIIEIYGPESSGKTSIALHAAANVQRAGGKVAMVDAEHSFDPEWGETLGVDIGNPARPRSPGGPMLVNQPDFGEQGLEVADRLARSGGVQLVIVDSVSALVPKAELEGEMGDTHVGLQARLMSQGLRKLTGGCSQTKTTVIFINQLREKVGVLFGSPETTSGGKALKFYASIRLDVRRIETLKDGGEAVGNRVRVKVVKNKLRPPFKVAEFDFLYTEGISRVRELIDFGVIARVIRKSGAWYTYDGKKLGQGKDNAAQHLRDHPDVAERIELELHAAEPAAAEPAAAEPADPALDPLGSSEDDGQPADSKRVRITG